MGDQDADFLEEYKMGVTIDENIVGLVDLMKELKNIVKQIVGPVPKEHKEEVNKLKADKKKRKLIEKQNAKLETLAGIAEEKKEPGWFI